MRIALDAMGGDYAPRNTVAGAVMALKEYPKIEKLFLTGDQSAVKKELQDGCSDGRIEIIHTTQVVGMNEHPVDAIRRKKDSSVSRAIDLVKRGDADAIVSAGHTGAMVAGTTIKLRTLEGVERPGICLLSSYRAQRLRAYRRGRKCRRPPGAHAPVCDHGNGASRSMCWGLKIRRWDLCRSAAKT